MKTFGALISLFGVMLLASASFAATCPESVPAPKYNVGDRFVWGYAGGSEKKWEVTGVDGNLAEIKWNDEGSRWTYDNAGTFFLDQDWVIRRGINKRGKEVLSPSTGNFAILGKSLLPFPLHVGKAWEVSYVSSLMPSNHSIDLYFFTQKVVGCEEVTTPAKKFLALKIDAEFTNATRAGWGTIHQWYSPEAKNIVKFHFVQCYGFAWCHQGVPDYELIKLDLK